MREEWCDILNRRSGGPSDQPTHPPEHQTANPSWPICMRTTFIYLSSSFLSPAALARQVLSPLSSPFPSRILRSGLPSRGDFGRLTNRSGNEVGEGVRPFSLGKRGSEKSSVDIMIRIDVGSLGCVCHFGSGLISSLLTYILFLFLLLHPSIHPLSVRRTHT